MKKAISSLTSGNCDVFYFENRLEFLVSATVLDNSHILIDAVGENSDDVRWLSYRLSARGLLRLTYFIVSEDNADNVFLKFFLLVSALKDLKKLCERASKVRETENPHLLKDVLYQRLSEKLSGEHFNFLLKIYDKSKNKYCVVSKNEINKNYYVRSRLALGNSLEMKKLILILSSQSTKCL
nr:hypothetical protein [Enterobacter asburiae]